VNNGLPKQIDILLLEQYSLEGVDANGARTAKGGHNRMGAEVEQLWHQIWLQQQKERGAGALPPAVILFHAFEWVVLGDPIVELQGCLRECTSRPECGALRWGSHDQRRETALDELAHYYGWSTFSLRNFVWTQLRNGQTRGVTPCQVLSLVFNDRIHLSPLGTVLVADGLISHLAAANAYLTAHSEGAVAAPSVPALPLIEQSWEEMHTARTCFDAEHLHILARRDWEFHATELVHGHKVHKPGLISSSVASMLEIQLDAFNSSAGKPAHIALQYLRSYTELMGAADLACAGGCSCTQALPDGRYEADFVYRSVSMVEAFPVLLTPSAAGAPCVLRLAVNSTAHKHGVKVKILGIVLES
jgi:hypothetical protein